MNAFRRPGATPSRGRGSPGRRPSPRLLLLAALGLAVCAPAPEREPVPAPPTPTKLRILVDKVLQQDAGWRTHEWMVEAAAQAGFNVYSPRQGHRDLDEVERVAEWSRRHGIFYMPWMRGSLRTKSEPSTYGRLLRWSNGVIQPLWSPNSDELWSFFERYILEYARISARNPHLLGVFLDFENYGPKRVRDFYELSYDELILGRFLDTLGISFDDGVRRDPHGWLVSRGRLEEFRQFQLARWRGRARKLRQAVDAIAPAFRFCIYPAPGTDFIREALYTEWSTPTAPLLLADASSYGRASRFIPQHDALRMNREKLRERMALPRAAGIPFRYLGGLDPVVTGADPEFLGKDAIMIAEVTDGYWVFYEGPTFGRRDHARYWEWLRWANRAIIGGRFEKQHEPRETPDPWLERVLAREDTGSRPLAPRSDGSSVDLSGVTLRGDHILLLAGRPGQAAEISVQAKRGGRYPATVFWDLRAPDGTRLAHGRIEPGRTEKIRFTPKTEGPHLLGVSAGQAPYSLVAADIAVGIDATDGASFMQRVPRLYFHVAAGVDSFSITARGSRGETVRVNVRDPAGRLAGSGQTTLDRFSVEVRISTADRGAGAWSLEVAPADEGLLDDSRIHLSGDVLPVLSWSPEHVFRRHIPSPSTVKARSIQDGSSP